MGKLQFVATIVAVVVASLLPAGSSGQAANKEQLSVNSGRPVPLAAEMLEQKYGWIVTYEDPPYDESELVDVTAQVRRDLDKYKPGQAPKVLVPKGGELTFEYDLNPATKRPEDAAVVIQQLLDAYSIGNPGVFRLDRNAQRLHIVPVAARNKDGSLVRHQAVFDTPITIPPQKRNGSQLLEAFCAAVTQASGTRVLVGSEPINLSIRYEAETGAKDQKARDFLDAELDQMTSKAKLSWRLLYNTQTKTYYLNIRII